MALADLLSLDKKKKKIGLSEERVRAIIPIARQYVSFYREYPDLLVDHIFKGPDSTFNFYFYQRVFLRAVFRHKYVYTTYPRAYSKSFLVILSLMLRCILYPGSKLFVTSGGKEQAAGIMHEKVSELCTLIPGLRNEIDWRRGETLESRDQCLYKFKNGSSFDNVAARESSRGKRRHGGVIEEAASVDGEILSTVILPIMNVSRACLDGSVHPEEPLNKSQVYVTTAGYKNTFAYDKLIQILVWQIVKPETAITLGGTYRIPVLVKLLDKDFVRDLKMDGTFNESAFAREYESKWSGTSEDAFFDGESFDKNRVLKLPQAEANLRMPKTSYYVIAVDVARHKKCDSIIWVFNVQPQAQGESFKSFVNIYTLNDVHFEEQAIFLKKLFYKFKARRIVIDANGLGTGLVDFMVKQQINPDTGVTYADFGVYNDPDGEYKKYKTSITEQDALYLIKANAAINTEAHTIVKSQMQSGKIKLLVDEKTAKARLLGTKVGQNMTPEQRKEYLIPFTLTSVLKEEMLNLREQTDGTNILLKRANTGIGKDKFSAFEYGLYYVKTEEDDLRKRKKKRNMKDWLFMN